MVTFSVKKERFTVRKIVRKPVKKIIRNKISFGHALLSEYLRHINHELRSSKYLVFNQMPIDRDRGKIVRNVDLFFRRSRL